VPPAIGRLHPDELHQLTTLLRRLVDTDETDDPRHA